MNTLLGIICLIIFFGVLMIGAVAVYDRAESQNDDDDDDKEE